MHPGHEWLFTGHWVSTAFSQKVVLPQAEPAGRGTAGVSFPGFNSAFTCNMLDKSCLNHSVKLLVVPHVAGSSMRSWLSLLWLREQVWYLIPGDVDRTSIVSSGTVQWKVETHWFQTDLHLRPSSFLSILQINVKAEKFFFSDDFFFLRIVRYNLRFKSKFSEKMFLCLSWDKFLDRGQALENQKSKLKNQTNQNSEKTKNSMKKLCKILR